MTVKYVQINTLTKSSVLPKSEKVTQLRYSTLNHIHPKEICLNVTVEKAVQTKEQSMLLEDIY